MDDALVRQVVRPIVARKDVLILVLMDDALVLVLLLCFGLSERVLILVLMDDALVLPRCLPTLSVYES